MGSNRLLLERIMPNKAWAGRFVEVCLLFEGRRGRVTRYRMVGWRPFSGEEIAFGCRCRASTRRGEGHAPTIRRGEVCGTESVGGGGVGVCGMRRSWAVLDGGGGRGPDRAFEVDAIVLRRWPMRGQRGWKWPLMGCTGGVMVVAISV